MTYLEESLEIVTGLQEEVYSRVELVKVSTEVEDLVEYYHYLYALLEKQQILMTRLGLMNDEKYNGILLGIEMVADAFGRPASQSTLDWHIFMKEEVLATLSTLTGEPIDPSNISVDITWET